ncbi:MAG: hypothetical protein ACJA1A_003590 [Saprospiraceae bacterium]|jgi:hypothetical protein
MKLIFDTENNAAAVVSSNGEVEVVTQPSALLDTLSASRKTFDTGFLPQLNSGLLRYRQVGQFSQVTYQVEPQETLISWGNSEGSSKNLFNLAIPYKIWVADFNKDLLVGLRHFFSPIPAVEINTTLYHTSFPNTNCKGYQNTSVGWVCLYRTGKDPLVTVSEKIQYAFERESGLSEPYNDANMSQTDGPRFYQENNITLFENGHTWQKKTQKEGIDWVCDPSNLIEIKTSDKFHKKHDANGVNYTLQNAMEDFYQPYYPSSQSDEERGFYGNGNWSTAKAKSTSVELSTQEKNLLRKSEIEGNPEEFVSNFSLKVLPEVDFGLIDFDSVAKHILETRDACVMCLCFVSAEEMTPLVPSFNLVPNNGSYVLKGTGDVTGNNKYSMQPDCKDEEFASDLYVCQKCISTSRRVARIKFEDDATLAFITHYGYSYLMSSANNSEWKNFFDQQRDNQINTHIYSIRKKSPNTDLTYIQDKFIPNLYVHNCNVCSNRFEDIKWFEEDFVMPSDRTEYGIIDQEAMTESPEYLQEIRYNACVRCVPKSSSIDLLNMKKNPSIIPAYAIIKNTAAWAMSLYNEDPETKPSYIFSREEILNLEIREMNIKFSPINIMGTNSELNDLEKLYCACKTLNDNSDKTTLAGTEGPVCDGCNLNNTFIKLVIQKKVYI